ncbi:class I SAM-dependent methyltransferase [Actinacidiphila epipremni]|uniref:Class I SAM-dependent methyltransferase n=1 Tax=Actinacidiphila epipremni TaxID=2053013 RepID=A0ABX0ZNU0_9ACTN|nr:class I SAM-dependent methyltransferase [Actinacidiphila epipremni]NJP44685.1 class I SAM-dependent methyltransferase [Actinacidiphila epipremni]
MDWHQWHDAYDVENSSLQRRLRAVRERVAEELDACPPGPVRVLSVCGGQGRDLIGALTGHPRAADTRVRLVELDERNAEDARRGAREAGLDGFEVVVGDAALTRHYADLAPADLVLMCGVFGNIPDDDIRATVRHCRALCRQGAGLVWTRHRKEPDLVPRICAWLAEAGFEQRWVSAPGEGFGVGVHRLAAQPAALEADARMFTFVGYDTLRARG